MLTIFSCSPACESCTGPAPSDCLACASPRANLAGTCVGYDATNAICDSTLSPLKGVFVVNNGKRKCDGEFLVHCEAITESSQLVLLAALGVQFRAFRLQWDTIKSLVKHVKMGISCKMINA